MHLSKKSLIIAFDLLLKVCVKLRKIHIIINYINFKRQKILSGFKPTSQNDIFAETHEAQRASTHINARKTHKPVTEYVYGP